MHEWVESEIPAILLGLIIILLVSLGFAHQVTVRPSRKEKTFQKSAEEDSTKAEAELGALADYKSMWATNKFCAICQNPSTRRCSRCKSVRYCSSTCQGQDWREGHRKECRAPDTNSLARSGSNSGNGRILQRAQSADSKNLLDSLSSRSSRSDSNSNSADFSNGEEVKLSQLEKPVCNSIGSDGNVSKPKQILFPYDYFVDLFNWDLLSLPCGLINCGNSCFANVVLQCLTYTRPLTAYLLGGGHVEDCRRNDWCFMCELQNHVWKVRKNQNAFSPIRILSRIRNIGGNLGYGRQEDAHEFMRFAIDSMQSICLDEVGGEKVVDPATQETTLIHHIFGGHLQSQVKCLQCQHESNRYENMMDLAVEIHGFVESLEDAIAQFTAPEMLDGENKYKCDRCNAYVKARKRLTVHEAPNVMTIALKRFQSGKFGKLNKRVTFPDVLDMAPYMSGKGDIPPVYRLYAVVVHVDMLNASFFGHYICYVKDSNGVWYKIDDSKVKEVDLDKVMSQRAYMLFYSRSVARKAPLTEGQSTAPATVPVSVSTIDMDRLTIPIEPQRSSIFPPTLGTIAVPTDLARGYSLYEALTPDPEEDDNDATEHQGLLPFAEVSQRADASGKDVDDDVGESSFETKETDLEPTSSGTSEGEELLEDTILYVQNVSSLEASASVLEFRSTNGQASTSQFSNSIQFLNGIVEQIGVPADSTGDSLDRGGKRTHDGLSYFSGPRLLDIDPSPVLAAESYDRSFSESDLGGSSSSSTVWPKGVADLVSSSVCSMLSEEPAVSLENRGQSSVEADTWKYELSARAKRQHLELSSGRLGYTGPGVDDNCRLMEIDGDIEGGESHEISERFLEVLSDECAGEVLSGQVGHEMQGGRGLIQSSSKDLLELESLCGRSAYQDSHPEGLLRGEVSAPAIMIPWVSTVPFLTETTPGDSNNVAQPSQGRVLIEELQEPIVNITNIRKVSKEDVLDGYSFDLKTVEEVIMEDDAPYMIMEPISYEPEQFEELPSQREEMVGQASESDVQEITKEIAAALSGGPLESSQIEESPHEGGAVYKTEVSPVDILETKKQIIKPLIAPGFFNRNPRPRSAKSFTKKVQVITTAHENEGSSPSENIQLDTSGETRHASIAQDGTEAGETEKQVPNGKPSSQVTSNGNHSNGKTSKVKESIAPTSDIKSENGVAPALVGDWSATGKHKQGRNESCACGSQQKWKKCCGKASGIKGGLPARRLVV